MNTFDRFCPRCRKEYHNIDNYGTYQCRIHTGTLRTGADGRMYYTCCEQNTRPVDYHPKNDKLVHRNFGFNYKCSRIRLPPPCTPCDHGDIRNKDGTDKTITFIEYYTMLNVIPAAQADARIQLLIANGALPPNPSDDTEIFRIQTQQDSDVLEDMFDEEDEEVDDEGGGDTATPDQSYVEEDEAVKTNEDSFAKSPVVSDMATPARSGSNQSFVGTPARSGSNQSSAGNISGISMANSSNGSLNRGTPVGNSRDRSLSQQDGQVSSDSVGSDEDDTSDEDDYEFGSFVVEESDDEQIDMNQNDPMDDIGASSSLLRGQQTYINKIKELEARARRRKFHNLVIKRVSVYGTYEEGNYIIKSVGRVGLGLFSNKRIDAGTHIASLDDFGSKTTVEGQDEDEVDAKVDIQVEESKHPTYLLTTQMQRENGQVKQYIHDPYNTIWGFMNDPYTYTPVDVEWYGGDLLFKYPSGQTEIVPVPGNFTDAMKSKFSDFYVYKFENGVYEKKDLQAITPPLRVVQIRRTRQPNVEVTDEGIFALRNIKPGDELLFEYGDQYPWADLF